MDTGFEEVEKKQTLPPLSGLEGLQLPPLPGITGLKLPLVPLPLPSNASNALAALKDEMGDR